MIREVQGHAVVLYRQDFPRAQMFVRCESCDGGPTWSVNLDDPTMRGSKLLRWLDAVIEEHVWPRISWRAPS